eukprot:4642795-Pyramimonas_sp.AAC.1
MAHSGHSPSVGPSPNAQSILAASSCLQWPCSYPIFVPGLLRREPCVPSGAKVHPHRQSCHSCHSRGLVTCELHVDFLGPCL